jgi:hypothetical protein
LCGLGKTSKQVRLVAPVREPSDKFWRHELKRLLLTLVTFAVLVTGSLAQPRNYDNASAIVVYTNNQTLDQNMQSLNDFIDENIEPGLEYTVTAESGPFDFLFGFRLVHFRAFGPNGEVLMDPGDFRVLDGLIPFWAQETPLNITAVYTNDLGDVGGNDTVDLLNNTVLMNQSTNGVITLSRPAPAGGLRITLRSSNAALRVPTSVTIPAGQYSAIFTARAGRVTRNTTVRVTARIRGLDVADSITIRMR